jgi:outer membrane protein TolC
MREVIFNVEQAYWRVFQARRSLTVTARLLTNLESILHSLQQRLDIGYDVILAQVKLTESRFEQRQAEFVRIRNQVRNAEDALKALINDADLNLARDLEIIPITEPSVQPLIVDVLGEVTAALSFRAELREARLQIEQAQVAIGVAKNQALPRLDVVFRYMVDGLGGNWDQAFNQMSDKDFDEYMLQLQFEWPIGNRGPEAVIRQARLRQAQAIAAHRAQIENVILETQTAIRDLHSAFDQIGPSLRAAQASFEQLAATRARQTARDVATLQVELDAHELLATSRQNLLQALADHNIAIVNLERRKGTLLMFNNIVLSGIYDDTKLDPDLDVPAVP